MGYGGYAAPFGAYPQPPASIPPYFNSMLEAANVENDKLNLELEELKNGPSNFDNVHKRAEGDIEKLKKSLLPQGLGTVF